MGDSCVRGCCAGQAHTFTTTIMRRSDGAPLAGWIVRYDVSGGAGLGYGGGSSVDSTTDAAGRASVEVSPKDPGGGVTNVGITIIRPATIAPSVMPRLELGRSAATITWGAASPAVPAPVLPAGPAPSGVPAPAPVSPSPIMPPPTLPSNTPPPAAPAPEPTPTSPPSAYSPKAPAAAGKPRLEVSLRADGSEQVAVGQYARFELTITNRGDGVASHILVTDHFDRGLRHPMDTLNEHVVKFQGVRDLQPNDSQTVPMSFQVVDGGVQCHEVTVTADDAEPVTQKGCITARQAAIEVDVKGPRSRVVGETAQFKATVKNMSDVEATNIEVVFHCDPAIVPTMAEQGWQQLPSGDILLKMPSLAAGEVRPLGLNGQCRSQSNRACMRVTVTADGGINQAGEACVEILPILPGAGGTSPGAAAQAASGLRLTVGTVQNPARVNEKQSVNVIVENTGQQAENQINVMVLLPQEFTIDQSEIKPQGEAEVRGQEIRFTPIASLGPGEQKRYLIPITPNRTNRVQIRAQIAGGSLATPKTVDSDPIDIVSGSP